MKWLALFLTAASLKAAPFANESEIASFLEAIASADEERWESTLDAWRDSWADSTPCELLSELSSPILEGENPRLVHLFRRALRNHDRFSGKAAKPFTFFYKHYEPPAFLIPDIELTLDVQKDRVLVTSKLCIERKEEDESLVLDGQNHKVLSVFINGILCSKGSYKLTPDELILLNIPKEKRFTVEVLSEIDPFHNHSLSGLYESGGFLTTQCESEGARKIFFTQDRPDVLSRIKTTLIADQTQYPVRISNGNLTDESLLPDGRMAITWEDPIPKPSYLFACVLGNLSRLEDLFVTRSGRPVALEVYVEPGKESRAAYSLIALKKAMEFDEVFFDREYDLDSLKMVAVADFNFGAMENKGLLIFNDVCLLADPQTGTDASFRWIAIVVAHEYFHNWSGNRVTVRNWFEIALKEAFTDFRASLFGEWLFGSEFIRPKDVALLHEWQFPEETSGKGHPLLVESYVSPSAIYDATTYIKGREVFRTLKTYLDMMVPDGFRKAQNLYFSRYDGQAVTFRELLSAANEVLAEYTGKDLSQFERWFDQPGTPNVRVEIDSLPDKLRLRVMQSCPHPETGKKQDPFLIPFSYEFLRSDGSVAHAKENVILTEESHEFEVSKEEGLIPVFMHGYSAPVIFHYDYSPKELACLMVHAADPFIRWDAAKKYLLHAIYEENEHCFEVYSRALQSPKLSALGKARLLQIPSVRAISQEFQDFDFPKLEWKKAVFLKRLAESCKPILEELLTDTPEPQVYEPTSEQMQVRELRHACLHLLTLIDSSYAKEALKQALFADHFDSSSAAFAVLANSNSPEKREAIETLYERWHSDKILFNYWLKAQASSSSCSAADLKKLMAVEGFDAKNPNHIRSLLDSFMDNLGRYHDPKGEGYAFIVDQILEISSFNPTLAHSSLAASAFLDFEMLPQSQQELMAREMNRLLSSPAALPETRDLIEKKLRAFQG